MHSIHTPLRCGPLALLVLTFVFDGDVRTQDDLVEILLTGDEYHSTELPNPEGLWWVLHRLEAATVLEALPVVVTPVRGCGDEGPDQRNGRSVSVPKAHDPILLLRGGPDLLAGRVETAFLDRAGSGRQERVEAEWRGQSVVVQHHVEPPQGDQPGRYRIEFTVGVSRLDLHSDQWHGDGHWLVRWIGDLNRDGWPDLLVDASYKYSVYTTRLFLSHVQGGQLEMREAAKFEHASC